MTEQKFDLLIFRQSRVLFGLFLTPFVLIGLIILASEIKNIFIGLLVFVIYLLIIYYYSIGHLTVLIENGELKFTWRKKVLFNYKNIEPVKINDIKAIVIDNEILLRQIITSKRTIKINNSKIQNKDIPNFLHKLRTLTRYNNVVEIDSWDSWLEKGYIKIAYRINTLILLVTAIAVTIFIIKNGFNSRLLFLIVLFFPQLILYGQQMKKKIK